MCKALEMANQFKKSIEDCIKYKEELLNQLSIVDKKKTDIEHYIELSLDLNGAQGYNAYKLLREVLRERREIKDKIDEIWFLSEFMCSKTLHKEQIINNLIKNIENKHNQNTGIEDAKNYKVRVLKELFGDTISKETRPA